MSLNIAINEKTSAILNVTLTDRTGALAPPVSVTYRIDDLTTGTAVLGPTPIMAPGAVFDISITSDQNAIFNPADQQETRRLTLTAFYAAEDQATSQYDWVVNNLLFVS